MVIITTGHGYYSAATKRRLYENFHETETLPDSLTGIFLCFKCRRQIND